MDNIRYQCQEMDGYDDGKFERHTENILDPVECRQETWVVVEKPVVDQGCTGPPFVLLGLIRPKYHVQCEDW